MSIFFHCPWSNNNEWFKAVKKKFRNQKIYRLQDKPNLLKIKFAIIWELPDHILDNMKNVRVLFSIGAGVDHILSLSSYKNQPIIRIKHHAMTERMNNHILSQILFFQLHLKIYQEAQKKKKWNEGIKPVLNSNITIGILGLGFLGFFVANQMYKLGYNVVGFKNFIPIKKYSFPVYYQKKNLKKFLNKCDVIVSILPSTVKSQNMINKNFFKMMKKKSLLINVGRGSVINEKDLISHLKINKQFGVSLDVFNKEPLSKSSLLWKMPNVFITPHVASLTPIDEAVQYIYTKYLEYKKNGRIKSDVNIKEGY